MTSIKDTFVQAVRAALPDWWDKKRSGTEMVRFEMIGAGLEAVLSGVPARTIELSHASKLMEAHGVSLDELVAQSRTSTWLPNPKHLHAVAVERTRQIAKGYDAAHDDRHDKGEIARGAAAYAVSAAPPGSPQQLSIIASIWPWPMGTFDPGSKQQDIVKAIAMLFAELERLERAK